MAGVAAGAGARGRGGSRPPGARVRGEGQPGRGRDEEHGRVHRPSGAPLQRPAGPRWRVERAPGVCREEGPGLLDAGHAVGEPAERGSGDRLQPLVERLVPRERAAEVAQLLHRVPDGPTPGFEGGDRVAPQAAPRLSSRAWGPGAGPRTRGRGTGTRGGGEARGPATAPRTAEGLAPATPRACITRAKGLSDREL